MFVVKILAVMVFKFLFDEALGIWYGKKLEFKA
jgi:hypothetical protein